MKSVCKCVCVHVCVCVCMCTCVCVHVCMLWRDAGERPAADFGHASPVVRGGRVRYLGGSIQFNSIIVISYE